MLKRLPPARVFALKGWTIKVDENGQYFVCPTACFEDKTKWSGPYKSLHHATNAIARNLQHQFLEREKRPADAR